MKSNKQIEDIILEASLDGRIPDGVVDLRNTEHVQVVAEILYDACEDETLVNEFIETFIKEGKHPERQAYNKDGWLVTFPSKEYRDAALKKGTHYTSDPTHGKGGMNLYYKKKGKQKRQTKQATTAVQSTDATQKAVSAAQETDPSTPSKSTTSTQMPADKTARASRLARLSGTNAVPTPDTQKSQTQPAPAQKPSDTASPEVAPTSTSPQSATPSIEVPVVTTPPEQYASVSKKFATKKGWISKLYGEYVDAEGNTVAVVGLSGEVVPIRSTDRDEYKLFAEKLIS